jgi:hypothetical protein
VSRLSSHPSRRFAPPRRGRLRRNLTPGLAALSTASPHTPLPPPRPEGPESDSDEELLHERMARWRRSLKQIFTGIRTRSRGAINHDLGMLSQVSEGDEKEDGSGGCSPAFVAFVVSSRELFDCWERCGSRGGCVSVCWGDGERGFAMP